MEVCTLISGMVATSTLETGTESFWESLGLWYNAVFFVPFGVVVLFMLLQLVGAGLNTVIEVAIGEGGLDADGEGVADTGDGHGMLIDVLVWFGGARIPFSYIAEFYFIILGSMGLLVNPYLFPLLADSVPEVFIFLISLGISFIASVGLTKIFSIFWIKYLPTNDYTSVSSAGFSGLVGEVISEKVDLLGGRAHIHDSEGHLQHVFVRTENEKEEIMKGEKVRLIKYLPRYGSYIVEKQEVETAEPKLKEAKG